MEFKCQVWFRYGDDQKDFEIMDIVADSKEQAEIEARKKQMFTTKVEFL